MSFGVVEGGPGEEFVSAISGHPFGDVQFTGERHPLSQVRLLAPMLPSKVVAIGRNYAEHARELGNEIPDEPLIFIKPSTSVIGHGEPIAYPTRCPTASTTKASWPWSSAGSAARCPPSGVKDVIFGYTCANDVTARDLQKKDVQFTRAKGFDTFCPLGPWIQTDLDPSDLALTTTVNGEMRQSGRTPDIHDIPALVAYVSAVMTLIPGDVILTGTPAGVGPLEVGDEVSVGDRRHRHSDEQGGLP